MTGVAIASLVLGALGLFCGGFGVLIGVLLASGSFQKEFDEAFERQRDESSMTEEQRQQQEKMMEDVMPVLGPVFIVGGVLIVIWAALGVIGGVGALRRSGWGRVTVLIAAGIGLPAGLVFAFFGIPSLMSNPLGGCFFLLLALMSFGHSTTAFVVLLNRKFAAEFVKPSR